MRRCLRRALQTFGWLTCAAMFTAATASAQTPTPLQNWQFSAGDVLEPLAGELPVWRAELGADLASYPVFEGSQRYKAMPTPFAEVEYRGRLFASTGEGVGVNILRGRTWRAGAAVSYDLGRDVDVERSWLRGLGDVHPAPEGKLFAEYGILPFVFTADLRRGFGGHNGLIGDLGVYMPVIGSEKGFLFIGPSVTFADRRYMQSYFGVTEAQASRSRFHPYDASAGLKSAGFGASGTLFVSEHWFLQIDAAYERLLDSAAASPITEARSQFVAVAGVGYKF
jgi:outer membrane scaffolding protein for murein synthesis (MipA/OmpV family)